MDVLQWKVQQVIPETHEASTFILEEVNGNTIPYEAGQFLTFLFTHHDHEIRRSYSLSSTSGIDNYISVTVKRKKNGEVSRHILKKWQPGSLVYSIPPAGRFTIETSSAVQRQFFFIAAGSGIVPVFSLLKKVLHTESLSTVILIYQNHNERSIIFDYQLEQLHQQFADRFTRIDLLSNPVRHHIPPRHLNNTLLEQLVVKYLNASASEQFFYTCGPDLFMRMVQFTVLLLGFKEEQVRKEIFTIDKQPQPSFTLDDAPRRVMVQLGKQSYQFSASYPASILEAAAANNIELPYSCRAGRCSTCVAQCISGKVIMSRNEVLTERDIQSGLVLTCVGYAETDVELKF